MRKIVILAAIIFMGFSLAHSQSLVELAKKEKARRAKNKGKKAVVVTNKDLKKMKFEPAVRSQPTLDDPTENPTDDVRPPTKKAEAKSLSLQPTQGADVQNNADDQGETDPVKELEEKWQKAYNAVGYLHLKMSSLWQEYYNSNSTTPRSQLQQQIAATYMQLQEAQKEEKKLKQDLEKARKNQRK